MANLTEQERKEMGFPFEGFPTKHNSETWFEWEVRCRATKFDMNELQNAVPADGDVAIYRDREIRNLSDQLAKLAPEVLAILKPSNNIAPYNWMDKYKQQFGHDFFDD